MLRFYYRGVQLTLCHLLWHIVISISSDPSIWFNPVLQIAFHFVYYILFTPCSIEPEMVVGNSILTLFDFNLVLQLSGFILPLGRLYWKWCLRLVQELDILLFVNRKFVVRHWCINNLHLYFIVVNII